MARIPSPHRFVVKNSAPHATTTGAAPTQRFVGRCACLDASTPVNSVFLKNETGDPSQLCISAAMGLVMPVFHFEHLAGLQSRSDYQLTRRLSNFELAESLGESPVSVSQKLDRLLRQHAKEWSAFTKDLGPRSFVRQWIRSSAS